LTSHGSRSVLDDAAIREHFDRYGKHPFRATLAEDYLADALALLATPFPSGASREAIEVPEGPIAPYVRDLLWGRVVR
jgi:hypothetical protein